MQLANHVPNSIQLLQPGGRHKPVTGWHIDMQATHRMLVKLGALHSSRECLSHLRRDVSQCPKAQSCLAGCPAGHDTGKEFAENNP